ncbi:MAG: hypothetical protein HY721_09710 [Planctomycetes bacterium]|nr:hypothetical protein [Planctomycetota bacterium]
MRNVQLGSGDGFLDRRVSAVRSGSGQAELLFTFLGCVESDGGRELERLIAVRVPRGAPPCVLEDPAEWQGLASRELQVPTAGVWEKHFAAWGPGREEEAAKAAADAFARAAA